METWCIPNFFSLDEILTADQLAQLVERQTTVREVAGSNPDRTKNQGLKIAGNIMLAVSSISALV